MLYNTTTIGDLTSLKFFLYINYMLAVIYQTMLSALQLNIFDLEGGYLISMNLGCINYNCLRLFHCD